MHYVVPYPPHSLKLIYEASSVDSKCQPHPVLWVLQDADVFAHGEISNVFNFSLGIVRVTRKLQLFRGKFPNKQLSDVLLYLAEQ